MLDEAKNIDGSMSNAMLLTTVKNAISDEESFKFIRNFLIEHPTEGIWICDNNYQTLFINSKFTQITGYCVEDIVGKPTLELFEPRYYPTILSERERRKHGYISAYEVRFKSKSGERVHLKINTYPVPNGFSIAIVTDLDSISNKTVHEYILETMEQAIWLADEEDRCIYANNALCTMLGYSKEEMHYKKSKDIAIKSEISKLNSEHEKRSRGVVSTYAITLNSKTGDHIPVRVYATPLASGGNLAVLTDLRNEKMEENAFSFLIQNMNEAVFLRNASGILEYANTHFCNLLGYTPEELIGDTTYFYWDETSRETVKKEQESRKNGKSSVYRAYIKHKNGTKIPVLVSGSPTFDGGSFGIITDIRDILEKESVYQNLVEYMNEAVWVGDKDEVTLYANPKFLELTEYTLDEALKMKSEQFWDDETMQTVIMENEKRQKGLASTYQGKIKSKTGRLIPVKISGTPTINGGTIGIITDIREILKKEEELKMADHYLASITEYSADAIIGTNEEGIIVSWNFGAEKVFGFSKDEAIGMHESLLIPSEKIDANELENINKEVSKRDFLKDYRTKRLHKTGGVIDVSLTKSVLKGDRSEFSGYSLIYRDVSIQKKWEDELNIRFENLKNAYAELGKKGRYMDYFSDLLDGIIGNFDINSIADFIVGASIMITKVDAVTLRIYDKLTGNLKLKSTSGITTEWYNKGDIQYKGSLVEKAMDLRKPLKVLDLSQESLYKSQKLASKHNLTSLLLIPLFVKSEVVGSLSLYLSKESKFDKLDNDFIEDFSKIASIALKLEGL